MGPSKSRKFASHREKIQNQRDDGELPIESDDAINYHPVAQNHEEEKKAIQDQEEEKKAPQPQILRGNYANVEGVQVQARNQEPFAPADVNHTTAARNRPVGDAYREP